jgi:hypothetical protein
MKQSIISLIIAVMFLGVMSVAQSQEVNKIGPCKDDIEKLCKDVKPGQGRILKCMREHENELSPVCKDHVLAAREKAESFLRACKSDISKYCQDIKPGSGRIINCLRKHESELSADCNAVFQKK